MCGSLDPLFTAALKEVPRICLTALHTSNVNLKKTTCHSFLMLEIHLNRVIYTKQPKSNFSLSRISDITNTKILQAWKLSYTSIVHLKIMSFSIILQLKSAVSN